ncbi:hypothetical protein [Leptospira levettii]|uniref:Uncharacterized protein n=1 Tax=Leptospira levettii TaxID=2023178 RepID=A0AAW5V6F1_9LEPT|nr:hypothetical protein [Leptospira levettii]MCW7467817.1 hypothetical protein [Leptospira levettii]MCW7513449.1 hypothetical protein [Leptospira levettii]MCW7517211.1 hypothetical protein [Leptospira levettii]
MTKITISTGPTGLDKLNAISNVTQNILLGTIAKRIFDISNTINSVSNELADHTNLLNSIESEIKSDVRFKREAGLIKDVIYSIKKETETLLKENNPFKACIKISIFRSYLNLKSKEFMIKLEDFNDKEYYDTVIGFLNSSFEISLKKMKKENSQEYAELFELIDQIPSLTENVNQSRLKIENYIITKKHQEDDVIRLNKYSIYSIIIISLSTLLQLIFLENFSWIFFFGLSWFSFAISLLLSKESNISIFELLTNSVLAFKNDFKKELLRQKHNRIEIENNYLMELKDIQKESVKILEGTLERIYEILEKYSIKEEKVLNELFGKKSSNGV